MCRAHFRRHACILKRAQTLTPCFEGVDGGSGELSRWLLLYIQIQFTPFCQSWSSFARVSFRHVALYGSFERMGISTKARPTSRRTEYCCERIKRPAVVRVTEECFLRVSDRNLLYDHHRHRSRGVELNAVTGSYCPSFPRNTV